MSKPAHVRGLLLFCAFAFVLLLPGCDLLTLSQAGRGIREGNDAVQRGDFQKAVECYEAALDGTMLTAEAHYRLGLVYEDKIKNEVAALHHFERYLELAPQGQFATEVKGYVERLRLLIVSRLAEGNVVPAREAARLKNENLELRQELGVLRDQQGKAKTAAVRSATATPTPTPRPTFAAIPAGTPPPLPPEAAPVPEVRRALPATAVVPVPAAVAGAPAQSSMAVAGRVPAPPLAVPPSYTVVSGDTLSKISRKFYGNSADWQKIADANKAVLPDPKKLKPGMVLTIPPK